MAAKHNYPATALGSGRDAPPLRQWRRRSVSSRSRGPRGRTGNVRGRDLPMASDGGWSRAGPDLNIPGESGEALVWSQVRRSVKGDRIVLKYGGRRRLHLGPPRLTGQFWNEPGVIVALPGPTAGPPPSRWRWRTARARCAAPGYPEEPMTVSAESSVRTVPTAEFHIPGLHAALDEVGRGAPLPGLPRGSAVRGHPGNQPRD